MTVKRLFDLTLSTILLILLSPLFVGLVVLIWLKLGRPVFFLQQRPGLHGRPFTLIKFRTLTEYRDNSGSLLPDVQRLTRFGKWLRSTSLDELPELLNVFMHDMSLVGPRPLLMEYLSLYDSHQARRHNVLPGMTGWAQVNGRNAISWEQRFELDLYYVENRNLLLDMYILLLTVWNVLARKGITPPDSDMMKEFRGNTSSEDISCHEG